MSPPAIPAGLAGMHPAYFALVMATGIVSIACQITAPSAGALLGTVALALFYLNIGFYAALWVLTITRVLRHRADVTRDLLHHGRSVGFFTIVPATCVLGSQCLVVAGDRTAALALWGLGIALWAVLNYAILAILTVKQNKPPIEQGLHGGWLLMVVAAQSISVLGGQLAPSLGAHAELALFLCLGLWLAGGMIYLWIISLIFYRYTFFAMSPSDLAPPYWINMGAAAISTLAGATLASAAPHSPLLLELLPFVRGMTVMWWATATFWIPMLVILGIWRHLIRRFPLRYDPLYWGAVFPLGMYTVCTVRLPQAMAAVQLGAITDVFVYVALCAWSLAALGLFVELARTAASSRTTSPPTPQ